MLVAAGKPVFDGKMVIGINEKAQIQANTMQRQFAWVDACTKWNGISSHIAKIINNILAIADME